MHEPIGNHIVSILEVGYETTDSYHRDHPGVPEEADGEMSHFNVRQSFAGVGSIESVLISIYLKNLFFNPGAGFGWRTESFYGMGFLELALLRKREMESSSANLAWQMGWKPLRWLVATYDLYRLEFNDWEGYGYGWESLEKERAWASKATFCFRFQGLPLSYNVSVLYAHGVNEAGLGGVLSVGSR